MHGQLAREFAETAYRLRHASGTDEAVEIVLRLASCALHCDHAGLMLCSRSSFEPVGATDPVASQAERLELELNEGPCVSVDGAFLVDDTLTDRRWPRWSSRVAELGVRSALSTRLESAGVLCVYDDTPGRFTVESLAIARILAAHAAPALSVSTSVRD